MSRNKPWPNPEKEWWDATKGKKVALHGDFGGGETMMVGILVWVTNFMIGLRLSGMEKVIMVNKGSIAYIEPVE